MSARDEEVARRWDAMAAEWAEGLGKGKDIVNESVGIPAFLGMVGDLAGREVLDAGCGEGRSSRHLARLGARVLGVDLSSRMLDLAREEERREPLGIAYRQASVSDLGFLGSGSFDVVVSFMALMDVPDYAAAVGEFARVLRPGGRFAFAVLHPCFFTRGLAVVRAAEGRKAGLRVAHYFDERPYTQRWRFPGGEAGEGSPFAVPRFPRTLAKYISGVTAAGLTIKRLLEPQPSEDVCRRYPFLGFWRRHGALYLCVEAEKPS